MNAPPVNDREPGTHTDETLAAAVFGISSSPASRPRGPSPSGTSGAGTADARCQAGGP